MRTTWMLAGLLLMATGARAEQELEEAAPVRRNVVALDVSGLLHDTLALSAERAVAERMSVRLGLRAGLNALWTRYPEMFTDTGGFERWSSRDASLELEPGARFFLSGLAPEGLWVGPQLGLRLGWRHSSIQDKAPVESTTVSSGRDLSVSASALAGYSAVLGRGFTLQAAAGLGLSYWRPLSSRTVVTSSADGGLGVYVPVNDGNQTRQWSLHPVTQLSLGYAF